MAFITVAPFHSRLVHGKHALSRVVHRPIFSSRRNSGYVRPLSMTVTTREGQPTKLDQILEGPFQGHFGVWNFTRRDEIDIDIYRTSLFTGAVSAFTGIILSIIITSYNTSVLPPWILDITYITWFISMIISLNKVHIYLKPLHQTLKFLFYAGFATTLLTHAFLTINTTSSSFLIPHIFFAKQSFFLAFCPQLAALTGLLFKEAFCFQRLEAVALTLLVPLLSVKGLMGWGGGIGDNGILIIAAGLYVLFAMRKFTQSKKDDLGDKSVFEYLDKQAVEGG